jgi:hypothetical protein
MWNIIQKWCIFFSMPWLMRPDYIPTRHPRLLLFKLKTSALGKPSNFACSFFWHKQGYIVAHQLQNQWFERYLNISLGMDRG